MKSFSLFSSLKLKEKLPGHLNRTNQPAGAFTARPVYFIGSNSHNLQVFYSTILQERRFHMPQKSQEIVPVDAANYLAVEMDAEGLQDAIQANLAGESLGFKDLRRIKFPSGGAETWSIPSMDGGKPTGAAEFTGVIIHTELARTMWLQDVGAAKPLPGQRQVKAPDCNGRSGENGEWFGSKTRGWIYEAAKDNELTAKFAKRAGAKDALQTCADCPFAQWDTGKGGKGQKCAMKRPIYIAMEDSLMPTLLIAPTMSLDAAKKYLLGLSSTINPETRRPLNYHEVLTEFSLSAANNGQNDYAQLVLKRLAILPEEQRASFKSFRAAIQPLVKSIGARAFVDTAADSDEAEWESAIQAVEPADGPTEDD